MVINMKRPETNSLKFQIVLLLVIAVAGVLLTGVYSLQAVIRSNRAEYDEWRKVRGSRTVIWRNAIRYRVLCWPVATMKISRGF